jgi:hypothetical protein
MFNNRTTIGKSHLLNMEKEKGKKAFQNLYELPFASVSEVNLIKKADIEYYKDLLSIDKKGKRNKRKSVL